MRPIWGYHANQFEPFVVPARARGMSNGLDLFDIEAAILRKSEADLRVFLSALAARLETSLPGRVEVERKRDGLFSSTSHVVKIEVTADNAAYTLTLDHKGLKTGRAKIVRGVTISSATVPVAEWMKEVRGVVSSLSGAAGDASDELGKFLQNGGA